MLVITLSPYILFPTIAVIFIAFLYVSIKNLGHVQILRHYEFVIPRLQNELKEKEDQLSKLQAEEWEDRFDSLFIQLFQWHMITDDYRTLIRNIIETVKNKDFAEAFQLLENKFKELHLIFETDRKKYMAELREKPDYSDEVSKVVSLIVEKFGGYGIGINATESPILNSDREN